MKSSKIRVYEFAKQSNVSAKELLDILKKGGFSVGSHMAMLDQEALNFLNKKLKRPSLKTVKEKEQVKTMVSTQTRKRKKTIPGGKKGKRKGRFHAEEPKKLPEFDKKEKSSVEPVQRELIITSMTPGEFSTKTGEPATGVILTLLKWGIVCPKNQMLPKKAIYRLAEHYDISAIKESVRDEDIFEIKEKAAPAVQEGKLEERAPVIVVMGHVDHGKTTLLDFIRKSRIAAKEKGGITQHLGAYEVETAHGSLVFLDTPGHKAFAKIRMRGAKVADIVVLVVAADDSIMPQTIEAIRHAKSMDVPVIVAINKIDKVEPSKIEAVKRDLSQHDLLPEDWGGQIVCVPISAKLGTGVDHLLEMIVLQSQIMELKADRSIAARGYILESRFEKGRGPVATLICQHGIIKKGDFFICGDTVGKVSSLVNSYGERVDKVGPSIPVRVAGFSALPEAGDFFQAVSQREYKKARFTKPTQTQAPRVIAVEGDINIIIKSDTKSSQEALLGAITRLSKGLEKGFHIVHSSVGDISESDVALAATTGSMVLGFHIKVEPNAAILARRSAINIRLFDIIYKLIEDIEAFAESKKEIKKIKTKIGEAVVLRVFNIKNVGVIAGCAIKDGRCSRDASLVIWRGKIKIGEGKIKSLQREKKSVKEVHAGFECGFLMEDFDDWEVDDRVECYLEVLEEKK